MRRARSFGSQGSQGGQRKRRALCCRYLDRNGKGPPKTAARCGGAPEGDPDFKAFLVFQSLFDFYSKCCFFFFQVEKTFFYIFPSGKRMPQCLHLCPTPSVLSPQIPFFLWSGVSKVGHAPDNPMGCRRKIFSHHQ